VASFVSAYNALNPALAAENTQATAPQYWSEAGQAWAQLPLEKTSGINQLNLADYLSATNPQISAANVATPQNYADVAALQSMLGSNTPALPISPSTASQAGTALNFNATGALNASGLNAAATQDQQALNSLEQLIQQTQSTSPQGSPGDSGYGIYQKNYQNINTLQQYLNQIQNGLAGLQ
jgi:alpha-ketoglutarate-dependent taurine dioxygenase